MGVSKNILPQIISQSVILRLFIHNITWKYDRETTQTTECKLKLNLSYVSHSNTHQILKF